jgi:flagellar L-ring protein FlgH
MKNRPIAVLITLAAAHLALAQDYPTPAPRIVSPQGNQAPPEPPPNVAELMRQSNGSLYRATFNLPEDNRIVKATEVSVFSIPDPKPKTMNKHDLVTIVVLEDSASSSTGTTDLKKDASIDGKINQFPAFSFANLALKAGIGSTTPELNLTGSRNLKGQGTVDRQDTFTTRIQAEVVDVKPNGTLLLQARKRITIDEEQQVCVLTGTCRVQDITPDNTVLSTQIYDSNIEKKTTGALRDTTKRGWMPRILDWINPF